MPVDLLQDASRRLGLAGLLMAALCALAQVLTPVLAFFDPLEGSEAQRRLVWTMLGASLAVFALSRFRGASPRVLLNLGLAYEVLMCFGVSYAENLYPDLPSSQVLGISWVCVLLILFPVLVPAPPLVTLAVALAGAATGPVSYFMTHSPAPRSLENVLALYASNFVVAFVAVVPSAILLRLGTEVRQAREMGSYVLEEKLGQGGMGEVWRARHRLLCRPAAVKLIRLDEGSEVERALARFEREARATAALRSAHTVTLYDFGISDDGTFYYVMELLEGIDLDALVERYGPVLPERAAHFLIQACASLEEAHRVGLVHRDIKPANIYACRLGLTYDHVKVLDFGLVKSEHPQVGSARLTDPDMVFGTPSFMAPEQALSQEVGPAADIYALGCVGYWLLTGTTVFQGSSAIQQITGHIHSAPQPPSRLAPQPVPPEMDRLILACLAKDPQDRPGSAQELGDRLAALPLPPWTQVRAREWWEAKAPTGRTG
jgi:serine/threonine-protein kinase